MPLLGGVEGSNASSSNSNFGNHLKYLMIDMNHRKNLSPHTAAIIPTDFIQASPDNLFCETRSRRFVSSDLLGLVAREMLPRSTAAMDEHIK
jgi:hypothetical protein